MTQAFDYKKQILEPIKSLRGAPGTEVALTIFRPSDGSVKEFKLTRAKIKVDTVKDISGKQEYPLLENKIGYVRLAQFGEQTSDDLEEALQQLTSQGMESLILDLRGNPQA